MSLQSIPLPMKNLPEGSFVEAIAHALVLNGMSFVHSGSRCMARDIAAGIEWIRRTVHDGLSAGAHAALFQPLLISACATKNQVFALTPSGISLPMCSTDPFFLFGTATDYQNQGLRGETQQHAPRTQCGAPLRRSINGYLRGLDRPHPHLRVYVDVYVGG